MYNLGFHKQLFVIKNATISTFVVLKEARKVTV